MKKRLREAYQSVLPNTKARNWKDRIVRFSNRDEAASSRGGAIKTESDEEGYGEPASDSQALPPWFPWWNSLQHRIKTANSRPASPGLLLQTCFSRPSSPDPDDVDVQPASLIGRPETAVRSVPVDMRGGYRCVDAPFLRTGVLEGPTHKSNSVKNRKGLSLLVKLRCARSQKRAQRTRRRRASRDTPRRARSSPVTSQNCRRRRNRKSPKSSSKVCLRRSACRLRFRLGEIKRRQARLDCELSDLKERWVEVDSSLRRGPDRAACTWLLKARRELQASIAGRAAQAEGLVFQTRALSALHGLLRQDALRYGEEALRLRDSGAAKLGGGGGMEGKSGNESENSMDSLCSETIESHGDGGSDVVNGYGESPGPRQSAAEEGEEPEEGGARGTNQKADPPGGSALTRSSSVKDLIRRFSDHYPGSPGEGGGGSLPGSAPSVRMSGAAPRPPSGSSPRRSPAPSITLTPPPGEAPTDPALPPHGNTPSSKGGSVADSGMGSESDFDPNKRPDSSPSEDEAPPPPRARPNPKYQLFLGSDAPGNGVLPRDPDAGPTEREREGEGGRRPARWEREGARFGPNYRGSLESLSSRDWDSMSDRQGGYESPSRAFNSPYMATASMDYNPGFRMSEFKVQESMSPAGSELNLFSYNGRSSSPVLTPTLTTLTTLRPRFSAYDTLLKRRGEVLSSQAGVRPAPAVTAPNKRDYIEELTRQMDTCQKRNQFLEAESVEMDKERNQIRLEMRALLVNNEDLLRTNFQLQGETRRSRERAQELEREHGAMAERLKEMEMELSEAREVMVEANTQEYAFNFLQQSLKNKIQDAEEALERQSQHALTLSEKLWLAERRVEELEADRETQDKRTAELSSTASRLEDELAEALQASTQASAELSLQQKLRADAQQRAEELGESLLEKSQELDRAQQTVSRLQGEVSGRLMDKQQTLEEEIQLRERMQLQWKQAERTVDDLQMELHTAAQARDDLVKQLKQAQEKMIDLESDLEEMHDSEQRWVSKHKRAIEQTEQLQLKLIQEKDLNDQLDCEKVILERQIRELRVEVEELQNSRVQDDVISKTETRLKELENSLRMEERSKAVLTNTIGKLERKINELSDQMEEEHKLATEQKDLMTQRIRSLKRQLNESEEEASRRDGQYRHAQRELAEERETSARLQRQLLDQHLKNKRSESMMMRQTLDSLRLDLSVDEEDEQRSIQRSPQPAAS